MHTFLRLAAEKAKTMVEINKEGNVLVIYEKCTLVIILF